MITVEELKVHAINIENVSQCIEIISHLPGYFYWKNKKSQYMGCNQNLAELAGLKSPSEIIGKMDKELPWGTWEAADFEKMDQEVMRTGKKCVCVNRLPIQKPDGNYLYIKTEKIPLKNKKGEIQGVLGIAVDISNEKKLEQQLLKQKQDNIIANMPGYIYWKNKNSEYIGCNNNLAAVSGLSDRSEIIGKTDFDFEWGKEEAEKFIADDQRVMSERIALVTEDRMPIKRSDGNYYWVRTEKMPLYEDGKVVGVLAVAVDITDQKLLEGELKEAKEKAEQSDKLKTEFVRNMEHDIRTPFSGIWGMSHHLWEHETDETKKEWLGNICECSKELLDYCNDILEFSKIEANDLPILEKKFDLHEVLDNVIKMIVPAAKMRKLQLKQYCDPNLPQAVIGDRHRLYRVLINLAGNAIKFTPEGEISIEFKLAKIEPKRVIAQFIVRDTGIGIPEDKQQYIYEKFARLTPSNKGIYKGIGLGLRIVKQFVQEMDGEVEINSEINKGTAFICTIPFNLPIL